MINMNLETYRQKVAGCWMGKNIGGTLGAPFEGKRGVVEIDFYTQDLQGDPAPNDDLDLQLVWLNAVEKYGRRTDASILGEYWHSFIVPNWSEYGMGMNNLRMGLVPPLSGWVGNPNRDSCGAFIRSEIWACLAPGHPEIAVRYAYEDAIVDHSQEGVYGEIFCAAVQSAAFAEVKPQKLIEIGLSWIPEACGVARGVRSVLASRHQGQDWKAARRNLLREVPDAFFSSYMGEPESDLPRGRTGYDAPANVAIFVLGWLYGDGDFGRSLCLAVGCGEDTDCTGATLGATLGILGGMQAIPERWKAPIGEKIVTISLNRADLGHIFPQTVSELTERVLRLTPRFLDDAWVDVVNAHQGYDLLLHEGEALRQQPRQLMPGYQRSFEQDVLSRQPFSVRYETPIYTAWLEYGREPRIRSGETFPFTVHLENQTRKPLWLTLSWHLPEEWSMAPAAESSLLLPHPIGGMAGMAKAEFQLTAGELQAAFHDFFLDVSTDSRHTRLVIPVRLLTASEGESW
jgi:ADP-ribosylglycohydrolase